MTYNHKCNSMNVTSNYEFTIIVPVYNEAENIGALEQALVAYIAHASLRTCALFVDDGSRDESLMLIKQVCCRNEHLHYIALDRNGGLSAAMKAGIDVAESALVGYMDADLQTTPEDFELLLECLGDSAMAIGIRARRRDTPWKRLQSKIANGFRRCMTGDRAQDTGCPLKVIRTCYAKRVPFFTGMHRFLPALVGLQGGRVEQVAVRHFPRVAGVSKYHLWNRLIGPFVDCFAFRWMRGRYINYNISVADIEQ